MTILSPTDYLFLWLENKKQPMHIAGLCLFEMPKQADDDFIMTLMGQLLAHQKATFPFGYKRHREFFWQMDENFHPKNHIRHIKLAPNSTLEHLLNYISYQHGQKLPQDRPLWELHLIENICPSDDGAPPRFAIWLKTHHALADGVACMRLLREALSTCPNGVSVPLWATTPKRPKKHHSLPLTPKSPLSAIFPIAKELLSGLGTHFKKDSGFISTFDAPKSILNQRITPARHLSIATFDKSRFSQTAKALSVTTNDLLLAVCAGALRTYLISQNALPKKPLIAFVPISLRRDGSLTGNQLSFLLTNLGTHLDDPLQRLSTIKHSMDEGKERFSRLSPAQVIAYSVCAYGWAGINLATGILPTHQAFNLIISNVPADETPLYLNGARLTGIYPASVLFDGQAMNITIANHQDKIDFGITACSSALPGIGQFLHFVADELGWFEQQSSSKL